MSETKRARLIERGANFSGGTYEIWSTSPTEGDATGICVDFNPCVPDKGVPETMAFPLDLRKGEVTSWAELGVWYEDATGGKAVRELGYEPIEGAGSDDAD